MTDWYGQKVGTDSYYHDRPRALAFASFAMKFLNKPNQFTL